MGLRSALATLVRDFNRMRTEFVGIRTTAAAGQGAIASRTITAEATWTIGARTVVVDQVRRETNDAVSLVLRDPVGAPFVFSPGQFLTLLIDLDGERVRRSYSISSSANITATATITIKRVADGRVSRYLVERSHPGMHLEVFGPAGTFTPAPAVGSRRLVLIAGGSGITPMMSILRTMLAREPETQIHLLYANRSEADIIFKDALSSEPGLLLAKSRLTVQHMLGDVLARETVTGELDALTRVTAGAAVETEYFLCGPDAMMREVQAALAERGVPNGAIHVERFTRVASLQVAPVKPSLAANDGRTVQLRVIGNGQPSAAVEVQIATDVNILRAALDAGLELPYSCAEGTCGTCRMRAIDPAAVDMDPLNCLSSSDIKAGYILPCVARAQRNVDLFVD